MQYASADSRYLGLAEPLFTGFYDSAEDQHTNSSNSSSGHFSRNVVVPWNKLSLSLTYRLPETVATFVNEVMYGGVHQSQSQQAQPQRSAESVLKGSTSLPHQHFLPAAAVTTAVTIPALTCTRSSTTTKKRRKKK